MSYTYEQSAQVYAASSSLTSSTTNYNDEKEYISKNFQGKEVNAKTSPVIINQNSIPYQDWKEIKEKKDNK